MAVTLTENAADYIKRLLEQQPDAVGLSVGLVESGCSGYSYDISLAGEIRAGDKVFEAHGVRVVIAEQYLAALDGMEIDYVSEGLNSLFKFNNPNARNACGCGESFSY